MARLVGLVPRPRPHRAEPLAYREGVLSDVVRHWRLRADWTGDGESGGDEFEVVDTEHGMWVLRHGGGNEAPTAWPTTPTLVWRRLIRMTERRPAEAT
ncbi:MAG: hypothetical protein ACRDN9_20185 [Streptosporangiaceae bacterium]